MFEYLLALLGASMPVWLSPKHLDMIQGDDRLPLAAAKCEMYLYRVPNGAYDEEPVDWRATNKIVLCIKKLETRRTSALARRARILAAVYSGSALPFADVLSLLGERLEVLHVL